MHLILGALALLCVAQPWTSAVEIIGEPPAYLTSRMKPSWRLVPLASAFNDLARLSKAEIQCSPQVQQIDQPLVLISNQELTLQAVLTQLERCTEARFSVRGKILVIEQVKEFDQRRREVRWYPLSEYGLLDPVTDAPTIPLGFNRGPRIGIHENDAAETSENDLAKTYADRAQLVEFIRGHVAALYDTWETEDIGIEARGPGPIIDFKETPEIHALIRGVLAEARERQGHPIRWQVAMGMLPKGTHIPTGIVTRASAQGVTPMLTGTTILNLSGIPGQRVRAAKLDDQSHIVTADVVDHRLDAHPVVVLTGRSATVRATNGQQGIAAHLDLAWVEEIEQAHVSSVHSTTSAPLVTTTGPANGTPVTTTGSTATNGVNIPLSSPVLWTWRPDFECLLPTGQALVLSSEHPRGQAVMVVEVLP